MADGRQPDVQAGLALVGRVVDTRLVRIDEVALAVFSGREVRHDDIGPGGDGLFPSLGIDRLVSRRRHHIDFGHQEAEDGDHLEGQVHALGGGRDEVLELVQGRVGVGDVRSEPDHRHIHLFKEKQVRGQVVQRLEGEAHHHAGTRLIPGPFQDLQAFDPAAEIVQAVLRMDLVV